jgi:plastocyanin
MGMKRIVRIMGGAVAATAAVGAAVAVGGGPPAQQIDFGDSFFSPRNAPAVDISAGGKEVAWIGPNTDLPHNIHQDRRLFHSGPPSTTVDEYQTDIAAGKYHYYCQVHGSRSGGMDGVVRIEPEALAGDGESVTIRWADVNAEAKHRYRVEFRRAGANKWKVWKKGTAQTQGQFGANDKPVNANPNRDYQVRARTFVKGNKKRRSGWSPPVAFAVSP